MISYLSQPIKSTVEPYHENVGLIAQVAQQKQSKYDGLLSTIFQKQNQLLNLDLSYAPDDIVKEKDNLLKEADNQLNKFASSDLTIPDNISKVENIFTPITSNQDVMLGLGFTQNVKENKAIYDEWRKDGKGEYDSANEAYTLAQASKAKQMTKEQFKSNYNSLDINAIKYRNIDKEFREAAKELGYNEENSVMGSDETGMYIITKEGKRLSMESVLGVLPNDAGITAQAKVNAWTSMQGVTASQILNERLKINQIQYKDAKKFGDDLKDNNKSIEDNIKEIKANSTKGDDLIKNLYQKDYPDVDLTTSEGKKLLITKLEEKKKSNSLLIDNNQLSIKKQEDYIEELKNTYDLKFDLNGNVISSKELDDNSLLSLKTQYYLENKKMDYAKAYSKNMQTIKVESNPYGVINANFEKSVALKAIEDQYTKENKILDAELDFAKGTKSTNSDSTSNSETESKLIPSPAETEGEKKTYTYEQLQTEMKQTTELVGSGDLGIDGKLAQSLIPQYSINGDNEKGKLEFEKRVSQYKTQMEGYSGDDNTKTKVNPDKTYGQVKKDFKTEKGYLDRRALLQAEIIQKQQFIDDLSGEKQADPKVTSWMNAYQKAEIERLRKVDPQLAGQYELDLKKDKYITKKINVNEKLKKYDLGSLTSKLVPRASSNATDPARMLVEDAKSQIFSTVKNIDKTKIQVKDFELKDGVWYVNYIDEKFLDTQESVPLSNEFIAQYASDFNVAAPIEIYKTMISQKRYHESGDTWSLPNKIIESPEIVIDGVAWKMLIDNSTPENMVRLGKTGQAPKDYTAPAPIEQVLKFVSGNSSSLSPSSNIFEQIKEKYLSLPK